MADLGEEERIIEVLPAREPRREPAPAPERQPEPVPA